MRKMLVMDLAFGRKNNIRSPEIYWSMKILVFLKTQKTINAHCGPKLNMDYSNDFQ